MTREDYCSFELSKLLKEKGFDGLCHRYDFEDWRGRHTDTVAKLPNNFNENNGSTSIPTHQMAMKWLREVHKLHIEIDIYETIKYAWSLSYADSGEYVIDPFNLRDKGYSTYEEAVEAAIRYSLENLI